MSEIRKTTLEPAFELASSGRVGSLSDLRRALEAEDHNTSQVTGPHMMRQLRVLIEAAKDRKGSSP